MSSDWLAHILAVFLSAALSGSAGQQPDLSFNTAVTPPAYTTTHPTVLFDHAHANGHQANGTYKPFADLIASDGYKVVGNDKPFSRATLDGSDVLVIVNPTGLPTGKDASAFTDAEIDAVRGWVQEGGALLLVVDQPPYGSAGAALARRFAVDVSPGYAIDKTSGNVEGDDQTELVFSRANKLLGDHPITEGRNAGEKINKVILFGGTSLKAPETGRPFLRLSDTAFDVLPPERKPDTESAAPADYREVPAGGRALAVAIESGKGRVVIFGEAAGLTAQVGPKSLRYGMNVTGTDNRQLALNIMHWLSRLLT